jgi:flagellar basal body-associated protein FliL
MSEEKNTESGSSKKKGLSMPIIIGIIATGVILLVVVIIFVISIMMNNMKNSIIESSGKDPAKTEEKSEPKEESLEKYEYLETGRITTNPLASTQFVVLNLGIFYAPLKSGSEEEPAEEKPAEGEAGQPKNQRLNALIRHQINAQVGDMDVTALQIPRDSLMIKFKQRLEPAFKLEGFKLREVILVEFIIQ